MINLVHVITDKPERLHVLDTRSPSPFAQTNALFALITSGLRHSTFSLEAFLIHMHTIRLRIQILFFSNLLPCHNIHGLCGSLVHNPSCICHFSSCFNLCIS